MWSKFYPNNFIIKIRALPVLFWITVVIPSALSIVYFGFFASDVYVSESRFVVRSPDQPSMTGLGLLLKTSGFSNSNDKIYATKDYLNSRDALRAINKNNEFYLAYSNKKIAEIDRFGGFNFSKNFEDLFKYYQNKVEIEYDSSSSITTLTVRAYTAKDAYHFNALLLSMAEDTVNRMSDRGRRDLVKLAEFEVGQAKKRAQVAAIALAAYRNENGVIDPEKQASVQLQMVSKLQDQLIATRTQLVQIRALAPASPQIPVFVAQEKALAREIDAQLGLVAGGKKSLADAAVKYERLLLEREFTAKQLGAAFASLEEAYSEARRKKAYVERVVQPNMPDYALEPRRLRGVFTTMVLGLVAWGILSMLLAGMLEHRD